MDNLNLKDIITEAYRLAELNIESETNLMLAADQRSATFCGILTATVAVVASMYDASNTLWNDDLGLALLAISAGLAAYSARSVKIYAPGLRFSSFRDDIEKNTDFHNVLSELAKNLDECSSKNRIVIRQNARCFNLSLQVAFAGFFVSLIPNLYSITLGIHAIFLAVGGSFN